MVKRLAHAIVAHPWVYDLVQRLAGREQNYNRLAPLMAEAGAGSLLDVGAGTGELARLVPPGATYIWLDNDPQKLHGFCAKSAAPRALLGDVDRMGLRDKSVDVAVCVAVSHHLTDEQLHSTLAEASRVCRRRLVFLDAVREDSSPLSKFLWSYDRGSRPRFASVLRSAIAQYFDIEHEEHYAIYHHYWLCAAKPKESAAWA